MPDISNLTQKQKIAQLLMLGFSGTTLSPNIKRLIADYGLGGVILFARNISHPKQAADLCQELQDAALYGRAGIPLFIGIDQEGGRVVRIKDGLTPLPPLAVLGKTGSEESAYSFACVLGRELRILGINMDFAPVLDINSNSNNPVIGDRSLGDNSELVSRLGIKLVKGLHDSGIIAVGKHFPGHGDTDTDSHISLPIVRQPLQILEQRELAPFKNAIGCGLNAIMSAHVLYPALDQNNPATLSSKILTGLLRDKLGFQGIVISDDLLMGAMDQNKLSSLAVNALDAGVDILLFGRDDFPVESIINDIEQALTEKRISRKRLDDAVKNILRIKQKCLTPTLLAIYSQFKDLGCAAHRKVMQEIVEKAGEGVNMKRETVKSFSDLIVWQKSHQLVLAIYRQIEHIPKNETYGLASQLVRTAVSIPASIVEGFKKTDKNDNIRFINIASSSLEECRYYIILAQDLGYIHANDLMPQLEEVGNLLEAYLKSFISTEQ